MGGARKFRRAEGRARGPGIWAGASRFFLFGVGGHAYWQAQNARPSGICIWHCPPLENFCCFVQGRCNIYVFLKMGNNFSIFFIRGGRARILTSAECTPKWNLHLTLPASGKILLFRARAVPHLCIFEDGEQFRDRSERKKCLDPITPGVHLRHNYFSVLRIEKTSENRLNQQNFWLNMQ